MSIYTDTDMEVEKQIEILVDIEKNAKDEMK
jgi:hypothetical protein